MKYIPDEQYKSILDVIPICCVDIIIVHSNEFLLLKRKKEEIDGGLWWVPGGRLHKNERWNDTVRRKAYEETGIHVCVDRKVSSYELFIEHPRFQSGFHCITTTFVVSPEKEFKIKIDRYADEYKWVGHLDQSYHPELRKMIEDAHL